MTSSISKYFATGAAIAILVPSAAIAELSALDVWDSWKSLAEASGQTISVGSQESGGGALILNDVTMTMEFPEGGASSTLAFLEFRERSDGTVAVTMAPDFPFSMSITPPEGESLDFAMIMRQSGTSIVASGDPGNITFDYLAAEISLAVDKIVVDGEDIDVDVQISMTDIDGKYTLMPGDMLSYDTQMAVGNVTYNVAFTDPEEGGRFQLNGAISDLKSDGTATLPADMDAADPAAMFSGGAAFKSNLSSGPSNYSMSLEDAPEGFSGTASSTSSSLEVSVDDGAIQYGGSAQGIQYSFQSPLIPFPEVNLAFAEIAFNLLMPVGQSDTPQDFAFLMKFVDLEISDVIWSMFDPGEIMPRDPATVALDVTGQMTMLVDIFDPDIADAIDMDDEIPAALHNMQINDITVSAAGAKISGSGEFTFDNTDLTTFDGIPAPTGAINMDIVGVNGLMDRLIQMGFLQQDQAMGARMMLGLFARPADGEDTLTSTIEVNGDGSVFANGQQLR